MLDNEYFESLDKTAGFRFQHVNKFQISFVESEDGDSTGEQKSAGYGVSART